MNGIPLHATSGLPLNREQASPYMALKRPEMEASNAIQLKRDIGNLKGKTDDAAKLRKAAEDFESVFMAQMLKQMRSTIHKEEMFHGGAGEDIFTEMLDEEFAKRMSGRGAGIADMMYRQLSRQFGIEDDGQGALPPTSGSGNTIQNKIQEMQRQLQNKEAPQMSVSI